MDLGGEEMNPIPPRTARGARNRPQRREPTNEGTPGAR
jgi:hypothetical protein